MSEHQKNNQPEIVVENIQEQAPSPSVNWIVASVVLAALLVSASVFYNTRVIIKYFERQQSEVLAANNQPGQQAAVPQGGNGIATVSDRDGQAVLGDKDAKVTMYEFSDFQCPFCQKFFTETFAQLKSKYIDTGKVKLVFRNFPLPSHQNAQKAGEAAECANRQGNFWQYHDLLFQNGQGDGTGLADADLKKYADSLGLNKGTLGFNKNQFNQCLDNGETTEIVKKDLADGQAAGINGTPSFVINGKLLVGAQPFTNFEQAIEAALK